MAKFQEDMKLFREVPPEKGTGLSLHKFKNGFTDPMYNCSLEEIEITEEDIWRILMEHSDLYRTKRYILKFQFKPIAEFILSKLKGE